MSDGPERPRFSDAQIAIAGMATAVIIVIIVLASIVLGSGPS